MWRSKTSRYPYSPDLTPNVEQRKCERGFSSPQETVVVFEKHVLRILTKGWKKCFENWLKHKQKSVNIKCEYFEEQTNHFYFL